MKTLLSPKNPYKLSHMTKFTLNIHEAKTHLSRYLKKVRQGNQIILCKSGKPVAEIIPYKEKSGKKRPFGLAKNWISIPKSFYDELTEDDFPGVGL